MKRERRRNVRVNVQIPVVIRSTEAGANRKVTTVDLSEGGMAIAQAHHGRRPTGRCQVAFTLPGTDAVLELPAEFAWEGTAAQAGLRFLEIAPEPARQLREWLKQNSPDTEQDDPPVRCQLTDLSMGGCYLEISSPFPVSTRVTLSMRAAGVEIGAEGIVRVMHPDKGMGVQFTQNTPEHREALEKFLGMLNHDRNLLPELLVAPEGLEAEAQADAKDIPVTDDPLLQLFRSEASRTAEAFQEALRQQRATLPPTRASAAHASA